MARGRPLLLIDGDSLAHRAYHGSRPLRGAGGRPINAMHGFAVMLLALVRTEQPRGVLACWDTLGVPTYRGELWPEYQSGREFDPEIVEQLDRLPGLVEAFGFAAAKAAGYEADDLLAAAVRAEGEAGGTALVVTSDRDAYQLVTEAVTVLAPRSGAYAPDRIDPAEVVERYGVRPEQVPDFIALRGDPSDKLPGAPGVGALSAAALLRRYGSLAAILKAGRFARQAEDLRLYRAIAAMDKKAPLPRLTDQKPTWAKAAALARRWQLHQLASRLEQMAKNPAAQKIR